MSPGTPILGAMTPTGEKLAIGGIVLLLSYLLSLFRFPLTWYVVGMLNLLALGRRA